MTVSKIERRPPHIGVLALQGSFAEHLFAISQLAASFPLTCSLVKTSDQLAACEGLIIPGGESTTISLLAGRGGLLGPLREFVTEAKLGRKAVYGTCAGMILLCDEVVAPKEGYEGLGGVECRVVRNMYGRQLDSFTEPLNLAFLRDTEPFSAIFIRAPAIAKILPPAPASPEFEVLARLPAHRAAQGEAEANVVMARQGGILISSFHPELCVGDYRVHEYWLETFLK